MTNDIKLSAGGCAGIILALSLIFLLVSAVFTFLFNAVFPGILKVGPVIDIWQGMLMVAFISLIAGFFKGGTSQ